MKRLQILSYNRRLALCFSNRSCSITSIVLIEICLVSEGMKEIADVSFTLASSELLSALLSKTSSEVWICEVAFLKSLLLDDKRCDKDVSAIDKRGLADYVDMPVDLSGSVDLWQARIWLWHDFILVKHLLQYWHILIALAAMIAIKIVSADLFLFVSDQIWFYFDPV